MTETTQIRYVEVPPRARTNHVLHLLLSLVTGGLWLPVWLLVTMGHKARNIPRANKNTQLLIAIALGAAALYFHN